MLLTLSFTSVFLAFETLLIWVLLLHFAELTAFFRRGWFSSNAGWLSGTSARLRVKCLGL